MEIIIILISIILSMFLVCAVIFTIHGKYTHKKISSLIIDDLFSSGMLIIILFLTIAFSTLFFAINNTFFHIGYLFL